MLRLDQTGHAYRGASQRVAPFVVVGEGAASSGGITIRDYPLLIFRVSIHDAAQSFDQLRLAKGLLHNGGSLCGRFRDEP